MEILDSHLSLVLKRCGFVGPTKHVWIKGSLGYSLFIHKEERFTTAPESEDHKIPAPYIVQAIEWLENNAELFIIYNLTDNNGFEFQLKHRSSEAIETIKIRPYTYSKTHGTKKMLAYALDWLSEKYSYHHNADKHI